MSKTLTFVLACVCVGIASTRVNATVFISEVFINPAGSYDDTREFVELMGTPGKKLDGYAIAMASGGTRKYYELGAIVPGSLPEFPEIDELFSLDGLQLGPNGILVLGIGASSYYPTMLPDSAFRRWNNVWNGGLDTTGKLQNDGSNTIVLIRNRPGATEADPENPAGLRWGKDINPDEQLVTPVEHDVCHGGSTEGEPCWSDGDCINGDCQPGYVDQYGNGSLDKGDPNGFGLSVCVGGENDGLPCGGNFDCPDGECSNCTLDLKGASTPGDQSPELDDDLEVVDEVSYEGDRGWEYDMDERRVDDGSAVPGLQDRRVHALGDPQGFNPDVLTRVDYRTKGAGWAPAEGATGELPGGNNWQDTATEQWIRGESLVGSGGQGGDPQFFYDNSENDNPDAIQPYATNVPLWLDDGQGADYDFTAASTYQIMAGRVNPLAVPFIPGDADRDGDCDAEDIAKVAAVFGDDDWIFSNSYAASPQTDLGDPATQIRPWDVDATGDNGVEPSDLQWTLNFQGNTDGRIVGRTYDSTTPSATGVRLNPNTTVQCTVTCTASNACGGSLTEASVGDYIDVIVSAQVTAGANTTAGQENGVMQFVHDAVLSSGGVLALADVAPVAPFAATRDDLLAPEGVAGDLGVRRLNGHTTSFSQGLTQPNQLYRVTFEAVGLGSTNIVIVPAAEAKFAAAAPGGLKVGHTNNNGTPASVTYPTAPLTITVTSLSNNKGDVNGDSVIDGADVPWFVDVLLGNDLDPQRRQRSDMNCDQTPDGRDIQLFVYRVM